MTFGTDAYLVLISIAMLNPNFHTNEFLTYVNNSYEFLTFCDEYVTHL